MGALHDVGERLRNRDLTKERVDQPRGDLKKEDFQAEGMGTSHEVRCPDAFGKVL